MCCFWRTTSRWTPHCLSRAYRLHTTTSTTNITATTTTTTATSTTNITITTINTTTTTINTTRHI